MPEVRSCHTFMFFYGNSLGGSKHNDIRFYLTDLWFVEDSVKADGGK